MPSSSRADGSSFSSRSRPRPSVAAGRSAPGRRPGPRRQRTRRWRAGVSRFRSPRGCAAPRRRRGPAREHKRSDRRYGGRRQRTCEKPLSAFCTSCLHGSESSLLGESSEASTSRRQLRPSMAMTLSMVSLRGAAQRLVLHQKRVALSCWRALSRCRASNVRPRRFICWRALSLAELILLHAGAPRIKFIGRRHL